MKSLLLAFLMLACSPAFTAEENPIGQEQNSPASSGHSGAMASTGTASSSGLSGGAGQASAGMGGNAGAISMGNGSSGANSGGNPPMAGGPAMDQGGSGGSLGLSECLAPWENLNCYSTCESSETTCQGIINCFVDKCTEYSNLDIQRGVTAERDCCK